MVHPVVAPGLAMAGLFYLFIICFSLVIVVLTVVAYWKICEKAGFPPPLSLLMLVPIANLVLILYIAFTEWPALKQNKKTPGI